MLYKKIIVNRSVRLLILKLLFWIPDSLMVRIQYRIKMGFWPNLSNPTRFTEKMQLYKIYYRNPVLPMCIDKYMVRDYVKNKGLGGCLNEVYGVYDSAEDIVFADLPSEFVIKSTDGAGCNNIIICRDKCNLNIENTIRTVNSWLSLNQGVNPGREWGYLNIKPKILVEKFIYEDSHPNKFLTDYKFFCFNGRVYSFFVLTDRDNNAKLNFYAKNWIPLNVKSDSYSKSDKAIEKPKNFDRMLEVSEILSKDFPHVRVDLYNIDGVVIFGEMTFYSGSGYWGFEPDLYDFELGNQFDITSFHNS